MPERTVDMPRCGGYLSLDTTEAVRREIEEELGMTGDARRCPHHPEVKTSSPDGLHDTPCNLCEAEMEDHD